MNLTNRSPEQIKIYKDYLKTLNQDTDCPFCRLTEQHEQYVDSTDHFWVIKNIFPYERWDGHPVEEHLMIVPKAHLLSLKHLSEEQSKEFLVLFTDYEHTGYNVYARTVGAKSRSLDHQHTHLIKLQ